jgi:poly(3-hydroxyalkanoate) synthetase
MLVNLAAAYDCVKALSETDFTEDLKALNVPIFLTHAEDDQIVPIGAAALKSDELVEDGTSWPSSRSSQLVRWSVGERSANQLATAKLVVAEIVAVAPELHWLARRG